MPSHPLPASRARTIVALIIVALTVIAVWKFIEYRTQPPEPPPITAPP
ncbi:MAG: hypothetical protein LC642_06120 [Verrucomicrobiaceae bacterium]|nr:hypothetical protein [Verrucomicrobiaceae bacterium]